MIHNPMKLAAFLNNIVPYHAARWNAASRYFRSCDLVEITNRDEFHVLEFDEEESEYHRHTLFPNADRAQLENRAIIRVIEDWLDRNEPDLIVLNGWSFACNLAALRWGVKRHVPCVVCSESNEFDKPRSAIKEFIKRRIVSLCSAALAGGSPQADYLVKLGIPRERVFMGYDVVDNRFFSEEVGKMADRRLESGLPERYFFACARFGKKKNLPGLIRAYARYRNMVETTSLCDLVIVGEGEERPAVERVIRESGIEKHVHLAGSKGYEDMPAYYLNAVAFIHASITEQWGLVVNEAMAAGLPVLVSDRCGCAVDLVTNGKNGWTFDPSDEEQLARFMAKISTHEDLRINMGRMSREIMKGWGPERFAAGLASAIKAARSAPIKKCDLLDRLILWCMMRR